MQPIELVYSIIDFLINLKDKFLLARLFLHESRINRYSIINRASR